MVQHTARLPSAGLNQNNINNPLASPVTSTVYTVTMANGKCVSTDSVKVNINPLPAQGVSPDTTIQITQSAQLTVTMQNPGYTYEWTPSHWT